MKYLINTTEVYRVDSENEAAQLIENAKQESGYILGKYTSQYKERKQKGEVIDSYWKVTLNKQITSEKEPECQTVIKYEIESAF